MGIRFGLLNREILALKQEKVSYVHFCFFLKVLGFLGIKGFLFDFALKF